MKKYLNNNFDPDKLINVFDELPLWSAPFGLKLLNAVKYRPDLTVLDIGFGTGFPLTELAMRLGNSSTIYGIDLWKEAIAKAKEKIEYYEIENTTIIEGSAEAIPMSGNSVDLITSNNGINNVQNIEKALAECSRILKPGGQFIQTMNLELSMYEFYNELENVLTSMGLDAEIKQMHEHIAKKRPTVQTMIEQLQRQELIITKVDYEQFNYTFADGTAMLNHYFIRLAFMDSWIALLPSDKVEYIFNQIETGLNQHSKLTGGLTLSIPFALIDATKA